MIKRFATEAQKITSGAEAASQFERKWSVEKQKVCFKRSFKAGKRS